MKVSYQWLKEYVDIADISPYDLAELLTRSGVAVDIVEKRNEGLEKIVVGNVLKVEKHSNAEKLNLCMVDIGQEEQLQIICGANNVAKGQKVPVAVVGATLPDGLKIKKAKLRGIESQGMICSAKELGMNEKLLPKGKTEGILVLPDTANIGEDIEPLLGLNDYVLELDLTPNRADCLSMVGVAYEVAAILNREVRMPKESLGFQIDSNPKVKIEIEAKDACNHYAARVLSNVKITESPQWLQNRLIAAGIRPINNVVDVTNFVLLEYGQPLHAFDFERLEQAKIVVRLAKQNETIVTLDEQDRKLEEQMLLITDGINPIAIAGVMGGFNSEVTDNTTSILLESAYFKGDTVRRTSRKLGLRSEASLRFEKGVDPNRIYLALNRAAELLQEIASAKLVGEIFEDRITIPNEEKILIQTARVNKLLGTELEEEQIISILGQLKFITNKTADGLLVEVPTRRQDITIEADIIEEVARIYGYDNIPTTLPSGVYVQGGLTPKQLLRRNIKNFLGDSGLNEVITYSFTSKEQDELIKGLADNIQPILLSMPLSEEKNYLRTRLLPNLLEIAKYNSNRRNVDLNIFEIGSIFLSSETKLSELPQEKLVASGLLTGSLPKHWQHNEGSIDFYYVKGILEQLFFELDLQDIKYCVATAKGYHPGRMAEIKLNGDLIGHIGQIHPELANQFDLGETYGFEIDLDKVMGYANTEIQYQSLPKYPAIQRDVALVVAKDVEANQLMETIYAAGGDLLESLRLFDVYISEQLGNNKKSIAFSLTYRSIEKTLTDEEVVAKHNKIIDTLIEKHHIEIRK